LHSPGWTDSSKVVDSIAAPQFLRSDAAGAKGVSPGKNYPARGRKRPWTAEPFQTASNVIGECYETLSEIRCPTHFRNGIPACDCGVPQEPGSDRGQWQSGRRAEPVRGPGRSQSGSRHWGFDRSGARFATSAHQRSGTLYRATKRPCTFHCATERTSAGYGLVSGFGRSGLWNAARCVCDTAAPPAARL